MHANLLLKIPVLMLKRWGLQTQFVTSQIVHYYSMEISSVKCQLNLIRYICHILMWSNHMRDMTQPVFQMTVVEFVQ